MSSPQTQTTSDLQAVADAIRSNDRFLLVTHENPDGDALGSLLATKLALDTLGKDSVMYLYGDAPLPREYGFMELSGIRRKPPDDAGERVLVALDCANETRMAPDTTLLENAPLTLDIDHHHDNSRFGEVNLVVGDASSTGEVLRDVFAELGVELTPGDRRGALHRGRHRHGPLPVHEHDLEGAAARGASSSTREPTSIASSRPSTSRSSSRS